MTRAELSKVRIVLVPFYVLLLFRYLYLLRKVTLRVTLFKVNFFFVLVVTETETTNEIPSPRLLWGSLDNDPVTNMKAIWDSLNVGQFLLDNKKYHLSLLRENSTTPSKHCTIVFVTVNGAFLGVFLLASIPVSKYMYSVSE